MKIFIILTLRSEKYIPSIVFDIKENPMPKGTFLNVNFPNCPADIKGFKLTRQGKGYWLENPDERRHPEGQPYYWLGGKWEHYEEDEESDVALLKEGYLTGVPIHINELTDHVCLKERKQSFENLFRP